jgi:hypothetical protein
VPLPARITNQTAIAMLIRPPIGPMARKASMPRPPSKSLTPHMPATHTVTAPTTSQPTTAATIPASAAST